MNNIYICRAVCKYIYICVSVCVRVCVYIYVLYMLVKLSAVCLLTELNFYVLNNN